MEDLVNTEWLHFLQMKAVCDYYKIIRRNLNANIVVPLLAKSHVGVRPNKALNISETCIRCLTTGLLQLILVAI